eukprot:341026_1
MYRALPEIGNKRLNEMWKNRDRQIHLDKLSRIRACIDNTPPREFSHLKNNTKRRFVQEERFRKIERENQLLLKKMIAISNHKFFAEDEEPPRGKSLNYQARRRELDRIAYENQRILYRIEDRRPYYDHRDWDRHWTDTLQYLRNISEYPYQEHAATGHRRRRFKRRGGRQTRSADGRLSRTASPTGGKRKKSKVKHTRESDFLPAHLKPVHPKRRNKKFKLIVSKGGHQISDRYCMVTIVLDKKERRFSLFVYEPSTREEYVVHVPIKTVDLLVRSLIVDRDQPANSKTLSAMLVSRLFFSAEGNRIAFSSALTSEEIAENKSILENRGLPISPSKESYIYPSKLDDDSLRKEIMLLKERLRPDPENEEQSRLSRLKAFENSTQYRLEQEFRKSQLKELRERHAQRSHSERRQKDSERAAMQRSERLEWLVERKKRRRKAKNRRRGRYDEENRKINEYLIWQQEHEMFEHRKSDLQPKEQKTPEKASKNEPKKERSDEKISGEKNMESVEEPKIAEIKKSTEAPPPHAAIMSNLGEQEIASVTLIQSFYRGHRERVELRERLNELGL